MNKLFLFVLVTVGLAVSSAFAGEVLVNNEGQVRVEEADLWRPMNAFEMKAYQNPGTEVFVWSSNHWEINFFRNSLVRIATNVVVYEDGKIYSRAKTVKGEGVKFFLGYKLLLIVTMMIATGSIVVFRKGEVTPIAFDVIVTIATIVTGALTLASSILVATVGIIIATAMAVVSLVVAFAFVIFAYQPATVVEKRFFWFFIGVFYISAMVVLIV